ncbi:MAG: alternative ribosome rescue aminoacyl-tRNA hydrolase ArfB [Parasphingopyxis sp.]|nr:aminoacyl-tRNA hydrolase [Sphingomonadales bacterium]
MDPDGLPADAVEESHLAATGPGGQNVNKVASAIQLRVDATKLGLTPAVYRRLKTLAGSRMTDEGVIVVTARSERSQEANRRDAYARIGVLLEKAHKPPRKRIKTRPSKAAKARRIDTKKARSKLKQARKQPKLD